MPGRLLFTGDRAVAGWRAGSFSFGHGVRAPRPRGFRNGRSTLAVPGVSRAERGGGRGQLPERAVPAGARRGERDVPGNDGTAGLLWLEPGSLGESTAQTWQFREFPAPNGEQALVSFLNEPFRQGAGEATANFRNDGTAGLLWLEPGSLGESTEQTWQVQEFPAPNGEQAAVNFLNEPLRQGPGEASVTPRGNGTAGLLWLEPGSLGVEHQADLAVQGLPRPERRPGGPLVPERDPTAGGRGSHRVRPQRRLRRDLLPGARVRLIPANWPGDRELRHGPARQASRVRFGP